MGDEEEPTDPKQVESKEVTKVLHSPPIYQLPEGIKKMDLSDTVCFYCGVSYLIFHEFDKLNSQLVQLELELHTLREDAKREKAQLEAYELGRLEWEKALRLEVQREAELREKSMKEELEERNREAARALRDEFEAHYEKKRKEVEVEYQAICEEQKIQLRRELEEKLRKQKEELETREKVLSDALQTANKKIDELREHHQQLEERLAMAVSTKEDVEQLLGKEKQRGEILRGVCVRQQQALRQTLSSLRSSGTELTNIRRFVTQLMGAWQFFKSQILQESTQVFSALNEKLQHSCEGLQKMREEKQHLTQQLMELKRQREEQLHQQENSEREHRGDLLRLKTQLEEKHKRWLSCQQRCDTMEEQLSLWDQKGEQMNQKHSAAAEEVKRLRKVLEKIQQEMRELRREREILIESHGRALTKMKEDHKQELATKLATALEEQKSQGALHMREQMEELQRQVELDQTINRGKHQLMLLQCQQDSSQLQQKLEQKDLELHELQKELQEERRRREEERRRRRREEEIQRQEAMEPMNVKNAKLQEEVALLQETVRRECEEREELTAALCQAQKELCGLRSSASHPGPSRPPVDPMDQRTPPCKDKVPLPSNQTRRPIPRFSVCPNPLQSSTSCIDKDNSRVTDRKGTGKTLETLGGEIRDGGTPLRQNSKRTEGKLRRTVRLMMQRKQKV